MRFLLQRFGVVFAVKTRMTCTRVSTACSNKALFAKAGGEQDWPPDSLVNPTLKGQLRPWEGASLRRYTLCEALCVPPQHVRPRVPFRVSSGPSCTLHAEQGTQQPEAAEVRGSRETRSVRVCHGEPLVVGILASHGPSCVSFLCATLPQRQKEAKGKHGLKEREHHLLGVIFQDF